MFTYLHLLEERENKQFVATNVHSSMQYQSDGLSRVSVVTAPVLAMVAWTQKDVNIVNNAHTHTHAHTHTCLLYTSPSPRDVHKSRMPSSA